mgnify:CR=1 FL=1
MIRPNYYGKSAGVGIELYILGIPSVDDEKMELSLDMCFRQVRLNKEIEFGLKVLLYNINFDNNVHDIEIQIYFYSIGTTKD